MTQMNAQGYCKCYVCGNLSESLCGISWYTYFPTAADLLSEGIHLHFLILSPRSHPHAALSDTLISVVGHMNMRDQTWRGSGSCHVVRKKR